MAPANKYFLRFVRMNENGEIDEIVGASILPGEAVSRTYGNAPAYERMILERLSQVLKEKLSEGDYSDVKLSPDDPELGRKLTDLVREEEERSC